MHNQAVANIRLSRGAIALAASLWFAPICALAGVAGTVDSLGGTVSLMRNAAPVQTLTVGASVNEGDQISTNADSWVLLEMVDGGSLTLRGKTRMRIDAYVYPENNKTAAKSWISLIEGALRSVTGAIGAFNPPSYRLSTPLVTLGIRGTDHETAYYPPGSTEPGVEPGVYDKVNQGETVLHSQRGDVNLKAGQAGFSDHQGARAPRVLGSIPAFYARHEAIDRPLANRMRLIQQRRERKIETFRQRMQQRRAEPAGAARTRLQQNRAANSGNETPRERAKIRQDAAKTQAAKNPDNEERAKRLRERRERRQEEAR